MKGKQPLVSVFIPYYNDAKFLRKSIECVLNQTYENWELILLNHATTDECREIAHSYTDKRIRHIDMQQNYGAGGGILFKKMLGQAKGKYIKPCCADDELLENCLSDLVEYMENNSQTSYAFGRVACINDSSEPIDGVFFENYGFNIHNNNVDELVLFKKGIGHSPWPAVIFRTEDLRHIDIDSILIMEFDMSLYLNLLLQEKNVGFLDKVVVNYRLHESQMSRDNENHNISFINNFEIPVFLSFFFKLKSIKLAKEVFFDSKYINDIDSGDEHLIPFVIAHYFAYADDLSANKIGYDKLYEILSDDDLRQEIENKFNYTVADFRQRYKTHPVMKEIIKEQHCHKHKWFYKDGKKIVVFGVKIKG